MHPHLHTKDNRGCEEVMTLLEECHALHYLPSLFGYCNEAKRDVNKCLRAARLERTAENRAKAKERRAKTMEIFRRIDEENS